MPGSHACACMWCQCVQTRRERAPSVRASRHQPTPAVPPPTTPVWNKAQSPKVVIRGGPSLGSSVPLATCMNRSTDGNVDTSATSPNRQQGVQAPRNCNGAGRGHQPPRWQRARPAVQTKTSVALHPEPSFRTSRRNNVACARPDSERKHPRG